MLKMRKYVFPVIIIALAGAFSLAQAQQRKAQPSLQKAEPPKKITHKGKAFLSDGKTSSGTINKRVFDSLIAYPLVAKDTLGREHQVIGYTFSYSERGLYEDSTGKLRIMADFYSTASENGKLPDFWLQNIRERSKGGDTAYFDQVISKYADTGKSFFYVQPLKLIITE